MWIYKARPYDHLHPGYEGFVYKITNLVSGKYYIGKKSFWQRRKDPRTGRKVKSESDWRRYYGSNTTLKTDRKMQPEGDFEKEILRLCVTKKEMSYWEEWYQWQHDVLTDPECYNDNIGGKYFRGEIERNFKRSPTKQAA